MTTLTIGIGAIVATAFLAYLIHLVEFTVASRRDRLTPAVDSAVQRRARKMAGVYVLRRDDLAALAGTGGRRAA